MSRKTAIVLHALSIVVAVGIGMSRVGVENPATGAKPKCTQVVNYPPCNNAFCGGRPSVENVEDGGIYYGCVANIVPNGFCVPENKPACTAVAPTLSCNTDCE